MTDELIEQVARIIDPSSWRVMDSEKASMLRKYKGRNIGWPSDQFQHKESMAKASAILAAINPHARLEAARIEALEAENERLRGALGDLIEAVQRRTADLGGYDGRFGLNKSIVKARAALAGDSHD